MEESSKRFPFCKFVVFPILLLLFVAGVVFFAKNKAHPSPVTSIPSVTPTPGAPVAPTLANGTYGAALTTSLVFLEIQKAGKLVGNTIPWRGDSALSDGKDQKLDLSKGLYDAGDHMKFGFPMAFTATVLSWTLLEYKQELVGIGRFNSALDSLQWITDYLINAHSADNVLCIQVGDPKVDHLCWDRPETMTEARPLLFINKTSPGSDVAAETAAALAAASIVFKPINVTYSSTLLKHAEQLFIFANNYTGLYTVTFPDLASYYKSSDYHDELLWAAAWLYHATGDLTYLQYTTDNGQKFKGYGDPTYFSWDDKRAGIQVLLSRVHLLSADSLPSDISNGLKNYRRTAESIMCVLVPGTPISSNDRTKGGLLWIQEWNSLQHTLGASFIATIYSHYMDATQKTQIFCNETKITSGDIRAFAMSQADYILGSNPVNMSYLVGYGSVFPQRVHHRGASIPADENPSCTDRTWLESPDPNPYVCTGALVGGPALDDTYKDVRVNAVQAEPTTTSSALFTGLLSALASNFTSLRGFNETQ